MIGYAQEDYNEGEGGRGREGEMRMEDTGGKGERKGKVKGIGESVEQNT